MLLFEWFVVGLTLAAAIGLVAGTLPVQLLGSDWGQGIVAAFAAGIAVGATYVLHEWRENRTVQLLSARTKYAEEKGDEPPIALTFWAYLFLGLLSLGAGIGAALFLGNAWVAPAVILTGVLGLLTIRVAELTGTFRWYAVAVFFSVGLFGAVVGVLRMLDEPRLQPVAFLMKDGNDMRAVEGVYVGQSDDRLWFASVALDDCGDDKVRSGSGRLRSVPTEQVSALSIGPQMGLPKLAHEARAMLDAVMAEHRGPERVTGPAAVRDAVALESFSKKRTASGKWVVLEKSEGLGRRPTLTLNGRRLRRKFLHEQGRWKIRLPRATTSGPVYADCGENTNRAFLTVPRPPLLMFTATAMGDGNWLLETRGSGDADGQIRVFSWTAGDRPLGHGRRVTHTIEEPGERLVRLKATDSDHLVSTTWVRLQGRLVRVYQSDLLFRFDHRKLTKRGAKHVRALRDEVEKPGDVTIHVQTDERGGTKHNRALSTAQAKAVARALLGDRAPKAHPSGLGEEGSMEGDNHRENRRVVVVIR